MATTAQIVANRANAQHSTGPRTDEGKARSAANSITHGFYSKAFIVRPDEQADFDDMLADLTNALQPKAIDALAAELFAQVVHASWNLHRLRILESKVYAEHEDPFEDEASIRKLELIARHRARYERTRQSALKQCKEYETNFCNFSAIPYEWRREIPRVVDVHSIHKARRIRTKAFAYEEFLSPEQLNEHQQEKHELETRRRGLNSTSSVRGH